MSSQDITTLVAALRGGILAIVGGFLGTLFSQQLARAEEKRTVIREKTEALYKLANQLAEWALSQASLIQQLQTSAPGTSTLGLQTDSPIEDLVMLSRLYILALNASVEELQLATSQLSAVCDRINAQGNRVSDEDRVQAAEQAAAIVRGSKTLQLKLESLIQY